MESQPIKYRGIEENLEEGMKGLGSQIKGIPHIILGNKTPGSPGSISQEVSVEPVRVAPGDLFNPKEQNIINKIKKWGLVVVVCIIVGYAGYKILF